MCRAGRRGYARVLIEINAEDEFFDKIEINYVDNMKKNCDVKPKPKPAVNNNTRANDSNINGGVNQEGFVEVKHRKNYNNNKRKMTEHAEGSSGLNTTPKVRYVGQDNVKELRKSANKYVVLSDDENNIEVDPFIDKRLIVDEFIKKKLQPTCEETKDWNNDMINYFKYQCEAMEMQDKENIDEGDCMLCLIWMDFRMASWNIRGMCKELKQKEMRKFIADEKVQNCSGWNVDEVDVMVVQSCNQALLCLVEIIQTKVKLFVSFVYASSSCVERRSLWNNLSMHKSIVNHRAWVLMGDFNVTLKPEEHSNGASNMTIDMNEFKDVVNNVEVEDLCSTRFQFTWTNNAPGHISTATQFGGVTLNTTPKVRNVGQDNVKELRKSANKYVVLSDDENIIEVDPFIDKRLIVDEFIKKKLQPTCEETKDWNNDMINYFKYQWEAMEMQDKENIDEGDVFENEDQAT
ncbi:RNA-directed DNA polymerase, eukaryota, reverse transcriptase zinc-binding domain protein [Tanacetum coccineum]